MLSISSGISCKNLLLEIKNKYFTFPTKLQGTATYKDGVEEEDFEIKVPLYCEGFKTITCIFLENRE